MAGEIKQYLKDYPKGKFLAKNGKTYSFYSRKYKRFFDSYSKFLTYAKRDINYRYNRNFLKKKTIYNHPKKGKKKYLKKQMYSYLNYGLSHTR